MTTGCTIALTERPWQAGYARAMAELAALQADRLRRVAYSACLADGTGIRAARRGAYTMADCLALAPVLPLPPIPAETKRTRELRTDHMPLTKSDRANLSHIGA